MQVDPIPSKSGLNDDIISKINAVFAQYPAIERVTLFGSRAKGNHRPGSDIDLAISGEGMTLRQLLKIENTLDDLLLPYRFDLALLHRIDNPELIAHIDRVGVVVYQRNPA